MSVSSSPAAVKPQAHPGRWKALAFLGLAQFMLILDVTVVAIALPLMEADLALSREAVTWVVAAYTVTFGGLMIFGGRLADLFGSKAIVFVDRRAVRRGLGRCPRAGRARRGRRRLGLAEHLPRVRGLHRCRHRLQRGRSQPCRQRRHRLPGRLPRRRHRSAGRRGRRWVGHPPRRAVAAESRGLEPRPGRLGHARGGVTR